MERTVPTTASEEIELYLRTIYSLLRSTTEVQIRTLEEVHAAMASSLHVNARSPEPDTSAFIYSSLRLPDCMTEVSSIILGQTLSVFASHGFTDIEKWEPVSARARRRRCFFNRKDTLAVFISSRTDIDDVIPIITAYQIEWNKLNHLIRRCPPDQVCRAAIDPLAFNALADCLDMSVEDLERLRVIWGPAFEERLECIRERRANFRVRLLSGSYIEYVRATREWWDHIENTHPEVLHRPVYFVSSNTHSFSNLLSGFALQQRETLIEYVQRKGNEDLRAIWDEVCCNPGPSRVENYLYYVLKKAQQSRGGRRLNEEQLTYERDHGLSRIPSKHVFDLEAQVIDMALLPYAQVDPRLQIEDPNLLASSDALILNIDYPLGLAAYHILSKIAEHVEPILGVYNMGKSAALNGVTGDVMIPNVVQDEHSENTYLVANAFTAADVTPYLIFGTVLDNQKGVSVLGTFLQNARMMDVFYREGFTDLEMEAGPYLSAVYEMYRPKRHPVNEIVNLYGVPFDIGMLHYVSDTPLSKGRNLGAGALSYYGMDSTYATSIAVLNRIFSQEVKRLKGSG